MDVRKFLGFCTNPACKKINVRWQKGEKSKYRPTLTDKEMKEGSNKDHRFAAINIFVHKDIEYKTKYMVLSRKEVAIHFHQETTSIPHAPDVKLNHQNSCSGKG